MAQIILNSTDGTEPMVIPITLTVGSSSATATPTFNPPAGSYSTTQSVTISSGTTDAAIYYTTDGSTPTTSSTVYKGPVSVSTTITLKAIAVAPGFPQSAVGSATYTINSSVAATPTATSTITIAEATQGATVYYTTNGTTPTTSSTKYTGPVTFTAGATLKFIAVAPGYTPSAVRTVTTTIN